MRLRLPDIRRFEIQNFKQNEFSELLKNLAYCLPKQLKIFVFNFVYINNNRLKVSDCFDFIFNALRICSTHSYLSALNLNNRELEDIVTISQWEHLTFHLCKLASEEEFDFCRSAAYTTKTLSFQNCGQEGLSNWKKYPHRLTNILKAIKNSGLKDSLKELWIDWHCGLTIQEAQEMVNQHGLRHIKVKDRAPGPKK